MSTQHYPSNASPLAKHNRSLPDKESAVPVALSNEITPQYWINTETGRYYAARLLMNLFGQWELEKAWGSLSSRRGRRCYVPLASLAQGQAQLQIVVRRRLQRGYVQR